MLPLMEKLTTGRTASLLSPALDDVTDWRPVLDNLTAYAQQGNAEETIAILQRLKGQLVSIGLTEHSEQTVTIMEAFRSDDRNAGQIMVTNFCQSLSQIFKALEQEVTVNEP